MKFTAYQHQQIAKRYLAKLNLAKSDTHNEKYAQLAQRHVEAYAKKTGKLPK